MRNLGTIFIAFVVGLFSFEGTMGQNNYAQKHVNKARTGIAIQGYDPVNYFSENEAVEGDDQFSHEYNGATYLFKNQENLKTFKRNPYAYAPQYGGWCAYAMGVTGDKVKIDPETFKIKDGMLYLFYNFRFNNTLTKWDEEEGDLKPKADESWNKIISKGSN